MVIDGKIYNARGKLNAILISCGLVAVFIVGGFFSSAIMKHLVDSIEQNAISSLRGTVDKIDTHNAGSSNRNSQVISFAEYCIKKEGGIKIIDGEWFLGDKPFSSNNEFSEDIITTTPKNQFAIYQKKGSEYEIISTSIKHNGKYINGVKLEDSKVKEQVNAGKIYYNRTMIDGVGFIAMYKPILVNGEIVGLYCTGQEDGKVKSSVSIFGAQKLLPNGFTIWSKDPNFCFVVPDDKKKDWSKMPDNVYQEMAKHKDGEIRLMQFNYLDTDYEMVYLYDPNVYSYIQFIYPVSDKYATIPSIVVPTAVAVSIVILILIITCNRLINKIFNDVGGEPKYVKLLVDKIAEGDMTESNRKKVETSKGILKSAYTMAENLKHILSKIYESANSMQGLSSQISGTTKTLSENAKYQAENADNIAEPYFFDKITGEEYIRLLCYARHKKIDNIADKNIFDLPLSQYVTTYSTGMKKKLALLAVLLQGNEYFVLDEPYNGIDINGSIALTEILLKPKELNKTVIISSHIFSTLSDTCDEILVLRDGIITETVQRADFQKLEDDLKNLGIKNLEGRLEL